ncbi:hypothetical protein J437_LFUL016873 [Ladona fulva]|uniref:Uncharacterized protein n=1 Tax=Ladona fulva TaxID=123851 RepID=A0A8K0P6C3_LADFU|nr:hypothetical protein J437_LFUL016873 [Ladona fulva]
MKVMVQVPGPINVDTRTLFERLERVNPGVKTTLWRPYDRVTSPSGKRFVIGVDEASAGTIAGPGFRNSIGLHSATFSFPGKPGAEAETEAPGEPRKVIGEGVGEGGIPNIMGSPLHTEKPPAQHGRNWVPGGNLFKRPGACIYVNGVDAMPLPQISTMNLAAAKLSFQERNMIRRIVICSSYLPYDAHDLPSNRQLEDLVNFRKTKNWDLLLLDRGSQPTFRNNVREEVIDITLWTSNIVHNIKEW